MNGPDLVLFQMKMEGFHKPWVESRAVYLANLKAIKEISTVLLDSCDFVEISAVVGEHVELDKSHAGYVFGPFVSLVRQLVFKTWTDLRFVQLYFVLQALVSSL